MSVCLSLFIAINLLVILSLVAIAGGLYFFFLGFHLLARKRLLLATPTSKIRSAALGLVEVNGVAAGPHTMAAPITGKPCFLYHTIAWQRCEGKKQEWDKVADETLHVPFFIDDATGRLLIEPLGADLDLHQDFREEYDASFFSLGFFSKETAVSPRVSVFLGRHGVVPVRDLRIEERSIKPEDALFIAGTLTENPGIQVRPFPTRSQPYSPNANGNEWNSARGRKPNNLSQPTSVPEIIRLQNSATSASTHEMSQQSKIAAALTRAGITKPEAWAAAGVAYQSAVVEEQTPAATLSEAESPDFNLNPPVVMMKGTNDPTLVISVRSQKEFVSALGWRSTAMVWGGAAITVLGIYMLLAQMALV